MTKRIYSTDSYARAMTATVVRTDVDDNRVLLDQTVFYPGGGGQPPDAGILTIGDDQLAVVRVTQDADGVWHWLDGGLPRLAPRWRAGWTGSAVTNSCGPTPPSMHSAASYGGASKVP